MAQEQENDPLAKVCGNCEHTMMADANNVACFGSPPTPVVMGARRNLAGGTEAHIESMRPIIRRTERACSLFKAKSMLILDDVKPLRTGH